MKTLLKNLALCALLSTAISANADLIVGVNPSPGYSGWIGFMNVFEIPQNGGGYVFGSGWGTADLSAVFSGSTLTLSPNTIGDPNPFWYIPSGGPGAIGNKTTDASMYVEIGALPGQTLTFNGTVLSDTLTLANNPANVNPLGNGWTSVAFIKDFAPDYSSFVSTTVALAPGAFSISLATINDPARHVQYGFETIGSDVWITDVAPYGNVQIQAVPEPCSLALLGLGMAGALVWRRRQ